MLFVISTLDNGVLIIYTVNIGNLIDRVLKLYKVKFI